MTHNVSAWWSRSVASGARMLFWWLAYYCSASLTLTAFMRAWGEHGGHVLVLAIRGEADRPFVYRQLSPRIVAFVSDVIRPFAGALVERGVADYPSRYERAKPYFGWQYDDYALEYMVMYFYLLAVLVALAWTWRHLLRELVGRRGLFADAAPVIALAILPVTFVEGGYVYDFPELLLTSWALLFWIRGRYSLYYPILVLALLNKESAALMTFWVATLFPMPSRARDDAEISSRRLSASRSSWRTFTQHGLAHLVLSAVVVVGLRSIFAGQSGTPQEWHLEENIAFFTSLKPYLGFSDALSPGMLTPRPFHVLFIVPVVFVTARGFTRVVRDLRVLVVVTTAVELPLFLTLGHIDEVRVFGPAFAMIFLLLSEGIFALSEAEARRPPKRAKDEHRDARSRLERSSGSQDLDSQDLDSQDLDSQDLDSTEFHPTSSAEIPAIERRRGTESRRPREALASRRPLE